MQLIKLFQILDLAKKKNLDSNNIEKDSHSQKKKSFFSEEL